MNESTMSDADRQAAILQITDLIGKYCAFEDRRRTAMRFPMIGLSAYVTHYDETQSVLDDDDADLIPEDAIDVDVRDLSIDGIGFLAPAVIELGDRFSLIIRLENVDMEFAPCRVQWCAPEGSQFRIGAAFEFEHGER